MLGRQMQLSNALITEQSQGTKLVATTAAEESWQRLVNEKAQRRGRTLLWPELPNTPAFMGFIGDPDLSELMILGGQKHCSFF